ncbi:uncharacterized protein [Anabrus simplex]|uniref:uncharacterized protein n=1 Tax=Anabrus simplex TaxID=316456 RepID=UPI0035A27006
MNCFNDDPNAMMLGLTLVVFGLVPAQWSLHKGPCWCSLFSDQLQTSRLLLQVMPTKVSCDASGNLECFIMCSSLKKNLNDRTADFLCSFLKRGPEKMQPTIFSNGCKSDKWEHVDVVTSEPFCCKDGNPQSCDLIDESRSTNK